MKPILCKIGLHWPLQRKRRAFTDVVSGRPFYICQCNCGKWWMAEGRYSLFKVETKEPSIWLTANKEEEKL
jgi:hypothetical protein